MTLSKLSARNARRQARDYLVYFVTVVMAAALLYSFNALIFSQEIATLARGMDTLPLMIGLASVVVPIDKLSILVTAAFSGLVLHEKLSRKAALGLALLTGGTLLMLKG